MKKTNKSYKSINYVGLVVPLIKAIQELKAENEMMETSLCKLGEEQWC